MTKNSARKKAVRARQAVTGEVYNAARALTRGPAGLTLDDCLANYGRRMSRGAASSS